MDLREALYIVNINNNNGISNAAKHLNVSQSSLSRCLQGLEDSIGEPLFIKSNGQYTATYIGTQYLSYANQLLSVEKEWNHSLSKHKNPEYGSVLLSIDSMYLSTIIPDVLSEFHNAYPLINIEITESNPDLDYSKTKDDRKIPDLSIFTKSAEDISKNDIVLGYDEILLCSSKNNKIIDKSFTVEDCHLPSIELEQVLDSRLIMFDYNNYITKYLDKHFNMLHVSPSIAVTTPNHSSAVDLLKSDLGLCFLPYSVAKFHNRNKEIDMFHFQSNRKNMALTCHTNFSSETPEYIEFLLKLIKNKFKTIL